MPRLFSKTQRLAIFARDSYKCQNIHCGKVYGADYLQADHRIPYDGTNTTMENGTTLCRRCNARKGKKQGWLELSAKEQRKQPLWKPQAGTQATKRTGPKQLLQSQRFKKDKKTGKVVRKC